MAISEFSGGHVVLVPDFRKKNPGIVISIDKCYIYYFACSDIMGIDITYIYISNAQDRP